MLDWYIIAAAKPICSIRLRIIVHGPQCLSRGTPPLSACLRLIKGFLRSALGFEKGAANEERSRPGQMKKTSASNSLKSRRFGDSLAAYKWEH